MISRCLIVSLTIVTVASHADHAFAQGTLRASSPGQVERDACMKEFVRLRKEAEERGRLVKAASARHAARRETCRLIRNFGEAEIDMIKYVEVNSAKCEIRPQTGAQIRARHENTEAALAKDCMPVGDFDPEPKQPVSGGMLH
jgi:hypothetical protein